MSNVHSGFLRIKHPLGRNAPLGLYKTPGQRTPYRKFKGLSYFPSFYRIPQDFPRLEYISNPVGSGLRARTETRIHLGRDLLDDILSVGLTVPIF